MSGSDVLMFAPILPVWLLVCLTILFAFGVWRTYQNCVLTTKQKAVLFALRMASFLILCWLMLQPSRREKKVLLEKPVLAVVVDQSASMLDNPLKQKKRRADEARDFLEGAAFQKKLKNYRVRYFSIGSDVKEGKPDMQLKHFNSYRSFLNIGLNSVADRLRAENVSGIVLLSDGLDQSNEELSNLFAEIPVFIPFLENSMDTISLLQDFSLENLNAPKKLIRNWEAKISIGIHRKNGGNPAEFPIVLKEGAQELRSGVVHFETNQNFQKAEFTYTNDTMGAHLLTIEMQPQMDGNADNNKKEFVVNIVSGEKNILYLEGVPRWEFKFLKRSLLNESNQKLNAYLRGNQGLFINFSEGSSIQTLPEFSAQKLADFSLIILGELQQSALSTQNAKMLADFVENGGALLLMGGAVAYGADGIASLPAIKKLLPATPLPGGKMMEGRFSVHFTDEGRTQKSMSKIAQNGNLPPILSLWTPVKLGSFASVWLAAADDTPVLITGRVGDGRVAMLMSDSLWRWQLGQSTGGMEKSLYAHFMTQLVQWLAPKNDGKQDADQISLVLQKNEVDVYEKVIIGAHCGKNVNAEGLSCHVRAPDGKNLVLPMVDQNPPDKKIKAEFFCTYIPEQVGTYYLEAITANGVHSESAVVVVQKPEFEYTGALCNFEGLREIAQKTGGAYSEFFQQNKLIQKIPGEAKKIERINEYPIWNHVLNLILLIVLFSAEWVLRRKWDLV